VCTVAETPVFTRYAAAVWGDAEREAFIAWIAEHPFAGDVIRGSGGCRKVRRSAAGRGKRGGARVIYFIASDRVIWLLIVTTKSVLDALPAAFLARLKREVGDDARR
jgi:hypothetical protein